VRSSLSTTACLLLIAGLAGCSTAPTTVAARNELESTSDSAMNSFMAANPNLHQDVTSAVGYAIFPEIKKAGLLAGGSYGRGEFYEHGVRTGYCDMTSGSVGMQAGVEAYRELILFQTDAAMNRFKSGQFAAAGNASAVAMDSGTATAARYTDGVAVLAMTKGGLMAEASIGGQNFRFTPLDTPVTHPSSTQASGD
jgi:lipid-binding SYLF domain-containing protein